MTFSILSRYLVKTYLEKFLLVLFVISVSLIVSNTFDLLNKTNGVSIGGSKFMQLILLKLPYLVLEILPLNAMLAMFLMNYALVNRNEMTIIWNSGISLFSFITPIAMTVFVIGVLAITIVNPLSTHMLAKYDAIATKAIKQKPHHAILSNMGIIISEKFEDSKRIYVIKSLLVEQKIMNNITILVYRHV
jgi:lipopolysaccharide export system permease protein